MGAGLKIISILNNLLFSTYTIIKKTLLFITNSVIAAVIMPLSLINSISNKIIITLNKLLFFEYKHSDNRNNTKCINHVSPQKSRSVVKHKSYINNLNDVLIINKKISDVTRMIENIAFQTNSLSLDAAVEATRASDNGHEFNKIADELRVVAKNATSALNELNNIFNNAIEITSKRASELKHPGKNVDEIQDKLTNLLKFLNESYASYTDDEENTAQSSLRIKKIIQESSNPSDKKKSSHKAVSSQKNNSTESDPFMKDKKPTLH